MTEKEYRSHQAISRSELWNIRQSPEKFRWFMDHPAPPSDNLIFGQLVHAMLLEPETVGNRFLALPELNLRTKDGKAERDRILAECAVKGLQPVTAAQAELASLMVEKCRSDSDVMDLLDGAHEVPFFWTDDLTGEECKCRVDVLTEQDGKVTIVDYKTTVNAMKHAFVRDLYKFGYHFQAGMYCTGVKESLGLDYLPRFVFVAQEKTAPFSLNRIELPEDVILLGVDLYREYLGIYHECKETGIWYGYNGPFGENNEAYLLEWVKDGDDD